MTGFRIDGRGFRVRAAGVAVREGRVLLNGWEGSRHLALPGGGVEFGEASDAALVREMQEELGVEVRLGRLLWIVESLYRLDDEDWHEIGFYWEMHLPETAACVLSDTFEAWDNGVRMQLAWVPVVDLPDVDLVPRFLVEGLREMPRETQVLVSDERARG